MVSNNIFIVKLKAFHPWGKNLGLQIWYEKIKLSQILGGGGGDFSTY